VKKLFILLALGVIIVPVMVFSGGSATYDIPHQINYQGMLTNNAGDPLTGNFDILFKIYNHPSSGSMLWDELQTGVWVNEGLFNVILGSVDPIDLDFYETDQYWLDITVGGVGGEHMPQRLEFTSVAFAYRAQRADTAVYAIQAESYPHNHDADYVNVIGLDSIVQIDPDGHTSALTVKAYGWSDVALRVKNSGEWCCIRPDGIKSRSDHGNGLYIDSAGTDGIEIINVGDDGISMDDIHDEGIYMNDVAGDGIWLNDIEGVGIYVNDANASALYVKKSSYGVWIDSTKAGCDGFYVRYAEDDGLTVNHADDNGVYVGNADDNGLHVYHADDYGVYVYDSDNDGIRVQSADGDGIEAYGTAGGGELFSLASGGFGLQCHSFNNLSTNGGLWVFGYGGITGTWSTKLSSSSGDVPGFMVSSRDVELIASGTGTLIAGQAQISFEPEFQEAVSSEIPVKVVLTAQGAPSGLLYVASKSNQGFSVERLEIPDLAIKSGDVTFDWIAIGRQKGYEQRPQILMGEEEWSADLVNREEEMRAEELKYQEELERETAYRQEMLEKQARKEAERKEREKQREGHDRSESE
jgi:hypothetical protein